MPKLTSRRQMNMGRVAAQGINGKSGIDASGGHGVPGLHNTC